MDEKSRRLDDLRFTDEQLVLLSRLSKNSSIQKEKSVEEEKLRELASLGKILETSDHIMLIPGTCATKKILTEVLPDLREAILKTIYARSNAGKAEDLSTVVEAVRAAVTTLKEEQRKAIKESFSLLRKQIDQQIERTKYQAIQSFANLSSEFSTTEKLPELNLDINPFEIRESFENVKRGIRSILMGHSTSFEEEITRLSSTILTRFEETLAIVMQQMEANHSKILRGLTETKEQIGAKIDELLRILVRESEILQYELEKAIKTLPLNELRSGKDVLEISKSVQEGIAETFDALADSLIITIRRTVDQVWNQINENVVNQLPKIEQVIENDLKRHNQEIQFLLKEEKDVYRRIGSRAEREKELAKDTVEAIPKHAREIKNKIVKIRDHHHKSSLSLARQATSIFEKQRQLILENTSWKSLGEETVEALSEVIQLIENGSATLDPSTQRIFTQVIDLLSQMHSSAKERLEESSSLNEIQEETNEFETQFYTWIDQMQESFNETIQVTTQEMESLSEKATQLSSSLEVTHKDLGKALENHQKTIDIISESLTNCQVSLRQQYSDFRKKIENVLAEEFVTLRSRMISPMQQTVRERKNQLQQLLTEQSANSSASPHSETPDRDSVPLMVIVKPSLDDFQSVITEAIKDTRYGLEGSVLGGINVVRRASTDTLGQFRKKIVDIKEEFLRTREEITKEMRNSLETINERLIHAFNQIELKLGRVIDNLLESYDALLGANPEMLKSAFMRTNEAISSLLDRLLSKLLEDTNDINQALMKQEALVRLENSIYSLEQEITKLKSKEEHGEIEKQVKSCLYSVHEVIRNLGIINNKLLEAIETQE